MNTSTLDLSPEYEIRFASLFIPGRGLAFSCNAKGSVDLDALTTRARDNYLFARAMVGREYAVPRVCPLEVA